MRRLVGISARNAVTVALPLAGALYIATVARQVMIRHYVEAINLQTANTRPETKPSDARTATPANVTASVTSDVAVPKFSASEELSAERQAAKLPAQAPPKPSAQDAHTRQIIISIPDRRLALLEDGQLVKVYPVAVGKAETPSPDGEFTVINHAVNPVYRHEGKEVAPGKDNPLGTRWMGLSAKGYGIHGTNVQGSVGKIASHGCFRMKKKDVEELYRKVQVGDTVSIRAERDGLTASLFSNDQPSTGAAVVAVNTTVPNKGEAQIAAATPVSAAAGENQ
jgi:lipoprotein-anchoring transpeptidase ErfK/SrfK